MIFYHYLTIIYLFFSSLLSCSRFDPPKPKSEKVKIADRVSNQCAKTLSERHWMSHCGDGGAMMHEVKSLFFAFTIYRPLSKEEARALLIDCAHEVIAAVNSCPEIQPYLLPGGFNEKSVQIELYIRSGSKRSVYPDLCACAYNYGKLVYHTNDPDDFYVYKTSERETYQEALSLLKKNQEPLFSAEN